MDRDSSHPTSNLTRRDLLRAMHRLALTTGAAGAAHLLAGCRSGAGAPPGSSGPAAAATAATTAATASATTTAPAPTLDLAAARFRDATEEAGLLFKQSHAGCGQRYFVEQVASGAAVFDANGDGYPDIYFPQAKPLGVCRGRVPGPLHHRLYLNDGHGRFTLAPNAFGGVETDYGIAAAVGDYDNDGHPDLYVCCFGKNKLFRNRGDGTFEDVTEKAGVAVGGFSTGAVWFDYDGDGLLDLYVLRYCEWDLAHDIPCQGPNGERDVCEPRTYTPSTNKLFHNNGDGTFTDVTAKMNAAPEKRRSLGVAAVDLDGDGRLDLFVANDLGPNYLLHNRGGGAFEDVAMQMAVAFGLMGNEQANMGVAVGDYDDSGQMSVLVTTFANEPFTLYKNDGTSFTDVSAASGIGDITRPYLGFGTGFFDTLNRGKLDLFFANGHVSPYSDLKEGNFHYREPNLLLLNDGAGRFVDAPDALPKDDVRVHRGACFASFTNNGKMDVLVTANDDRPTLLRNESAAGNWLLLKLTNRHGCCTPVGTRCVAHLGERRLTRVVLGGGSYGGDSDCRVHFGLGPAEQVDRLEIHWLSGKVQTLENVKGGQILAVKEEA